MKSISVLRLKRRVIMMGHHTVANKFEARWNFPNGVGAIDGKRVIVQQPSNSGSHFYDYKANNSIVLLAVFGTTSAFGRVLGQMVVRQTLPYGKIVT